MTIFLLNFTNPLSSQEQAKYNCKENDFWKLPISLHAHIFSFVWPEEFIKNLFLVSKNWTQKNLSTHVLQIQLLNCRHLEVRRAGFDLVAASIRDETLCEVNLRKEWLLVGYKFKACWERRFVWHVGNEWIKHAWQLPRSKDSDFVVKMGKKLLSLQNIYSQQVISKATEECILELEMEKFRLPSLKSLRQIQKLITKYLGKTPIALPYDVIEHLFTYLSPLEFIKVRGVSQQWLKINQLPYVSLKQYDVAHKNIRFHTGIGLCLTILSGQITTFSGVESIFRHYYSSDLWCDRTLPNLMGVFYFLLVEGYSFAAHEEGFLSEEHALVIAEIKTGWILKGKEIENEIHLKLVNFLREVLVDNSLLTKFLINKVAEVISDILSHRLNLEMNYSQLTKVHADLRKSIERVQKIFLFSTIDG